MLDKFEHFYSISQPITYFSYLLTYLLTISQSINQSVSWFILGKYHRRRI